MLLQAVWIVEAISTAFWVANVMLIRSLSISAVYVLTLSAKPAVLPGCSMMWALMPATSVSMCFVELPVTRLLVMFRQWCCTTSSVKRTQALPMRQASREDSTVSRRAKLLRLGPKGRKYGELWGALSASRLCILTVRN